MESTAKVGSLTDARYSELETWQVKEYRYDTQDNSSRLPASYGREIIQLIDNLKHTQDFDAAKRLARLPTKPSIWLLSGPLLKAQYQQPPSHASKIIERLGKIAKFFHNAVTLVQVAASSPPKFEHIKVVIALSVPRTRSVNILRGRTVEDMRDRIQGLSKNKEA